ncbi:hypothetical protein FRC10_012102, partial [Ceratobasidium sp. 414]
MVSEDRSRTSIYRFDRRPSVSASAVVGATLFHGDSGLAKDEYVVDIESSSFQSAQCEVEICFQGRVDLISIIKSCYAIAQDEQARNYSLQKYNCFFFSWTILMLVSRNQLPYTVPSVNLVESRVLSHLPQLTETVVDEAISLFQGIILDMTSTFRAKGTGDLVAGMSVLERAIWSLPTRVIQAFWQRTFRLRLRMGMRDRLTKHIAAAIKHRIEVVWSATMSTHLTPELLDNNLWLQDINEIVGPRLTMEIYNVLWDGILTAIAGDLELVPDVLEGDSTIPLPSSLAGKRAAQLTLVWNAVLRALLMSTRDAAHGQSSGKQEDNGKMFDMAWSGANSAILAAAKQTVARTRAHFKHKGKHGVMWNSVWSMWDECWTTAHAIAKPRALDVIDRVVEDIVATSVGSFVEAMQEAESVTVEARVLAEDKSGYLSLRLTSSSLGHHMQNIIRKDVVGAEAFEDVKKTMGNIWGKSGL